MESGKLKVFDMSMITKNKNKDRETFEVIRAIAKRETGISWLLQDSNYMQANDLNEERESRSRRTRAPRAPNKLPANANTKINK
jgi:hypothetical protein